jgi:hypothetical protein
MKRLLPLGQTVLIVVLSILCAPALGAWMLAQAAIRGIVKKTLDEARQEILARAAR